jgi:hypothetical protein
LLTELGVDLQGLDALSVGQRAMIAVRVNEQLAARKVERQRQKSAWIATARLRFDPGSRRACEICGKYSGVSEAHHVVPLAVQFDAGAVDPIHEHQWLCPTHHAILHLFIASLLKNTGKDVAGIPPGETDALDKLGIRFVELLTSLPQWWQSYGVLRGG